jgi:hypothetical protein
MWYFNSDGTYIERRSTGGTGFTYRGTFRIMGDTIEFHQTRVSGGTATGRMIAGSNQSNETKRLKFQMADPSDPNSQMILNGTKYWYSSEY